MSGNIVDPQPLGNIITVAKSGGDYETITAALGGSTAGDHIHIAPGTYIEPPLTIPDNVCLSGTSRTNTIIEAANPNNPLITTGVLSSIEKLILRGVTNSSCIYDATGAASTRVSRVSMKSSAIGIHSSGLNSFPSAINVDFAIDIGIGLYSDATGGGGMAVLNFQSLAATMAQADSGIIIINAAFAVFGFNGLYANGGIIQSSNIILNNFLTAAIRANNGGVVTGTNIQVATSTLDILQEHVASPILATSSRLNSDKISAVNWPIIQLDYDDLKSGDEGYTIAKELHVGNPERGYESVFGEGDSYTRGMLVYTETTGNVFTDVSAAARSDTGSTFTFPGVAADNRIYVASSLINGGDYLKHFGIKAIINTAAVVGAGEIVAEYWNGAAWIEFNHMSTEGEGTFFPYAKAIFERTGSEQIRFDNNINSNWTKNDPITPAIGTNYFWIRYSIKTDITTAPILEQFKLHTNRTEINNDGWTEYFGFGRPIQTIPWDYNTFQGIAPNSPADQNLIALDYPGGAIGDLKAGMLNNSFTTGVFKIIGKAIYAPYNIDTSTPLTLRMVFQAQGTGDVVFYVNFGITRDGDSITISGGPTSITGEQHLTVLKSVAAANQQVSTEINIDISEVIPRRVSGAPDVFWLSIGREAGAGQDTLNAAVNMIQISPVYTAWSTGSHQ